MLSKKSPKKHRARTPERFLRDAFLTFSGTPHAKHLLPRRFLDGRGPKLVSKVSDPYDAVQQSSKKHHARAPPRAKSDDPHSKNNDFGTLPVIPVIPRKWWHPLRLGPPHLTILTTLSTKTTILEHSSRSYPIQRMSRKWCHSLRLGAPPPHAQGARMTVVKQTPSNDPHLCVIQKSFLS